jgi:hypothetical protein
MMTSALSGVEEALGVAAVIMEAVVMKEMVVLAFPEVSATVTGYMYEASI